MINVLKNNNLAVLQQRLLRSFHFIPDSSLDRNSAKRYKRVLAKFEDFLSSRSDEVMDALTDSVRDFLAPSEIREINKRLDSIFTDELGEDLLNNIKSIENSLPTKEKNAIIKSKITEFRNELHKSRSALISANWGTSVEDAEKYIALSQVLSLSDFLVNRALEDIDWGSSDAVTDANILIGMVLYLSIKYIAMLKGKVTLESLIYAVSAVQVVLSESDSSSYL